MDKKSYFQIRSQNAFPILKKRLFRLICENIFIVVAFSIPILFLTSSFFYLLASPLISILMFRNFGLMHDAAHGSLVQSKKANNFFGILGGAICLLPFEQWKVSHLQHHFWSGNIEKDPVMSLVIKFPKFSMRTKNVVSFLWKAWFPILSILQHLVFWILSLRTFIQKPKSFYETASFCAPILFWGALLAFGSKQFIFFSLLPGILIYLLGTEVINLPHHLQLPHLKNEQRYSVWDQYKTARTCLYPMKLSSFLILNFNFHAEHHMFPDVPWYYLPEIQKLILAHIDDGYQSDPTFSWIIDNRKVDVEAMLVKNRESSNDLRRLVKM